METLYTVKLHKDDSWYGERSVIEGKPLFKKGEYYYFAKKRDRNAAESVGVYGEFLFLNDSEITEIQK